MCGFLPSCAGRRSFGTAGRTALAHIHLAHASLPPCDELQALRLFVADELVEAGVTPQTLMKAQGFDPAPLDLLKANFNQAQPRWAAGNGRDSGRWSGGAGIETAGVKDFIARLLLEAARGAARALLRPPEPKPPEPELAKPESKPPEAEQPPKVDANKLYHIFDNPDHSFGDFLSQYGSQEEAFRAIEDATRNAIEEQNITGEYKMQIEIGGYKLGVAGNVMPDGTIKIGTAYPWKD